ncbi:MAG: CDF family Co(II)/Ni(II) efflux transporter DmeF [Sandaracinaceae bacterium]|nr:CDF family Co(II)/Ni(II) efflux transporter DmeF [Sandaracinaceae bacterium]
MSRHSASEVAEENLLRPFEGHELAPHEKRARLVLWLSLVTMVVELLVGVWSASLALQADAWHMATHAGALGITVFGYWYARTHSKDASLAFGTVKVNALAGFASAVALGVVAMFMGVEAIERIFHPEEIAFASALPAAVIGFCVNLVSLGILRFGVHGSHSDLHGSEGNPHHHDHNFRGAYLHLLADSATSALAIFALIMGHWLGITWLDTLAALIGALLIAAWSKGLARDTARLLLDPCPPKEKVEALRNSIASIPDVRSVSVRMWEVNSTQCVAMVEVVAKRPLSAANIRSEVPAIASLLHSSIEVRYED